MDKKNIFPRSFILTISFLVFTAFPQTTVFACTIISGISNNGQVWNANNEDGPWGAANFINVFPSEKKGTYGYYTLSYSLEDSQNGGIQGGMNEAGLTYDFNSIREIKDFDRKKPFPDGDSAILRHIFATMNSVDQVVAFFETHWFQDGFNSAQLHVADRNGKFAIISPSGIVRTNKNIPLVSTNFDIAGNESSATCERYAVATQQMKKNNASYTTMVDILKKTAIQNPGDSATLYSNIQNLTTGEIWFFSDIRVAEPVKTTMTDLLSKGKKSYSFDDLTSIMNGKPVLDHKEQKKIELAQSTVNQYIGTYRHPFGAMLEIRAHEQGIEFSAEGIPKSIVVPQSGDTFFWPNENAFLVFEKSKGATDFQMRVYENGFRSFTARKVK